MDDAHVPAANDRRLIGAGDEAEAHRRALETWGRIMEDTDRETVWWLALAERGKLRKLMQEKMNGGTNERTDGT